jgi:CBS domain-containing membrane protein
MSRSTNKDLLVVPFTEGRLVLVISAVAWATQQPLVFASLGPTAYELIEQPDRQSGRPYNVILGHLIGVGSAFLALAVTAAWHTPAIGAFTTIAMPRMCALLLASALTAFRTLPLGATQPAALSTSLLIASGSMQRGRDAVVITAAVLMLTAMGEPIRRWKKKSRLDQAENPSRKTRRLLDRQMR